MKTTTTKLSLLTLAALPFLGGCTQPPHNASVPVIQQTVQTTAAPPPPVTVLADPVAKAEPAPGAQQAPPLIIQSAPAVAELTKLAQAGVDESVMLSYINNSPHLFNVNADQIVYLNDLGVSGNVITAMMQHDQSLKQNWAGNATQPAPSPAPVNTEAVAATPVYVAAPQPQAVESVPQQPVTVVNNNYFSDSLSPYGHWVEVEGYGRCWQPTVVVVNRDWRPYCDGGRWVYSDAGWYWLSDYSWGATTFHYGRWFSHPRWGWCWWPDNVWASSWVSWRYSDDYCGWAPLPPHSGFSSGIGFTYYGSSVRSDFDWHISFSWFNYLPWGRVCDPKPRRYCAPATQVTHIHNNTTIVNNYGSRNNNTVINNGLSPTRVRELSKVEIKPVHMREENREQHSGRHEQITPDGRTLTVVRAPVGDHRIPGRDQGVPTRTGNTPAVNVAPAPATPVATSPRATENHLTPRTREDSERGNRDNRNRTAREITTTPVVTAPPAPVSVTSPAPAAPAVQPHNTEIPGGRQRIEERRSSTVQYPTPPTTATPVNIPNGRFVPPQVQHQSPQQISQPTPAANTAHVWSQPQQQPQQPVRIQAERQSVPRIEERGLQRVAEREQPQVRNIPSPVTSTPALPRYSPQPQVSTPVAPSVQRNQTIESRPAPAAPAPAPIASPSRGESHGDSRRLESKKSDSNNSDSNNGRRNNR